ncbi:cyanophycinase [Robertkochia sp. 1368]|nr:cyanophycinase [Robertkochia sediminum]
MATEASTTKGSLFIIGGGKRPPELVKELMDLSKLEEEDHYGVILPMSSSEPDSSAWYARKQFTDLGVAETKLAGFNFTKEHMPQAWIDSVENASLVYISGGDQNRFMGIVKGTPIATAIHKAYEQGAVIAGTSAGAAVMSKKMITGDEYKHPEYTGEFRTIEAENIEIAEGLGLAPELIVDQHFIWRMRMNRLLSVAIEHPEEVAVGIDESTALIVDRNGYRTTGKSQIIVVESRTDNLQTKNGLLGSDNLKVQVVLPGETFTIGN